MSTELTTPINIEIPGIGTIESADFYLKYEADKVIAEQREKYKELAKFHDKAIQACCDADKVIHHQKYKRCLYMAMWCEERHYYLTSIDRANYQLTDKEYQQIIGEYWERWHKRWLVFAEKFKEVKNAED